MTRRALGWGGGAAATLAGFYVAVLAASSGWGHLVDQARADGWLLGPIIVAFGAQVAVTVELRHRHRNHHLAATTGAGTGASAVGMVACCAHHLAEIVPVRGSGPQMSPVKEKVTHSPNTRPLWLTARRIRRPWNTLRSTK